MKTTSIILAVLLVLTSCLQAQTKPEAISSVRVGCIMQKGYGSAVCMQLGGDVKTADLLKGVITSVQASAVISDKNWEGGEELVGASGFAMHTRTYGVFYAGLGLGGYELVNTAGDNKEYLATRIDLGAQIDGWAIGAFCDVLDVRQGKDFWNVGLRLKIASL